MENEDDTNAIFWVFDVVLLLLLILLPIALNPLVEQNWPLYTTISFYMFTFSFLYKENLESYSTWVPQHGIEPV